jgi:hypothetical protein
MAKILVDSSLTIDNINFQFTALYKYLRLGFFKESHSKGKSSLKNKILIGETKLSHLQHKVFSGDLEFDDTTTVWELENLFEKTFGLHVQIFRKSGNIWLETTATDNWTLKQQNETGQFLDEDLKIDRESPDEHDMY